MGRFLPSAFERVAPRLDRTFRSAEELLEHYRRELPVRVGDFRLDEVGPVMPHDEPGEADAIVAGRYRLGEAAVDMGGSLDWFAAPDGDLEWNGGLVRHGHLKILAREYRQTGREVYARTAVKHLLDYIERVPPFDPEGKPYIEYKQSTWRPFEVAARAAENWPEALRLLISSPAMTPSAWATILCSVGEHADFLLRHHWKTGNHATLETADLGLLGVFYPEFRDAPHWRAYAVDFLMRMWDALFHSDGYTREMSGGYHWVALRSYLAFYEAASRNGYADLFTPLYRSRLEQAAWAEFFQDKPDFSVPVTNDGNASTNRRVQLEQMARLFSFVPFRQRLDGVLVGTNAVPSAGPLRRSRTGSVFYPEARIAVMRSGWGPGDAYLFMDMGRWGDNHMNEDQLHVEVYALRRNFLCGCGRWRYTTSDPGASWMRKARYFKTTAAYNTVLVDGYSRDARRCRRFHGSRGVLRFRRWAFRSGIRRGVRIPRAHRREGLEGKGPLGFQGASGHRPTPQACVFSQAPCLAGPGRSFVYRRRGAPDRPGLAFSGRPARGMWAGDVDHRISRRRTFSSPPTPCYREPSSAAARIPLRAGTARATTACSPPRSSDWPPVGAAGSRSTRYCIP